jgi:hypothetical protein
MFVNKIENSSVEKLKTTYKLDDLQIIDVNNIISVLVKTNSINLQDNWKKINNVFSELLDEHLDSSFKKWNVYILYLIIDKVSKELKYKIENNTFFARKVVEDSYMFELSDENIKNLISEHIDFADLKINMIQPTQSAYESSSEIYFKLKNIDIISETQIDEMLKLLEGTKDEI